MTDSKKGGKRSTRTAVPHKPKAKLEKAGPASKKTNKPHDNLRVQEDFHRAIMNSTFFGFSLIDPNYNIVMTNRMISSFFHKPVSELLGTKCFREFEKRKAICPHCPGRKTMATGQPSEAETEGVRDDGSRISVRLQTFPAFDSDGKVTGFIELIEDITERKKAEEALRQSEKQASAAIEAARGFTFNYDITTGKINWGGAIEEITGYTPEEFAQIDIVGWAEMIHPDDKDRVLSILQKAIHELDRATAEYRFRTKNGGYVTLSSISLTEKKDGKAVRLVGILQDITERKKAEEALRERENLLRQVFNTTPNPIFVKDRDGRYILANKANAKLHSTTPEAMMGKTDLDYTNLSLASKQEVEKFLADDRMVIDSKQPKFIPAETFTMPDGTTRWFQTTKIPLSLQGNPDCVLGVAVDITERKKAEGELIRLNRILETITSISQDMFRIKDRRKLLDNICETIVKYAYKLVWIGFCDEKTKKVIPEAQAGFEEGYLESVKITYNDTEYAKGPTGTAIKTKKPSIMRCIATDPRYKPWRKEALKRGYRSSASIPIFRADKVIGTLNVYSDKKDVFNDREIKLLEELTHDISTGLIAIDEEIRRKQAEKKLIAYQAQLKSLASQLTLAEESERHRIATELHASIGQSLVISKMKLDELRASASSKELKKMLGEVCDLLASNIQGTRTLTFDLSSPVLYELGFEKAVEQWLSEQVENKYGIKTEFMDDGQEKPLDDEMRVFLFRDMRELLFNVVKHARATKVKVSVSKMDNHIKVSVEDDGWGFDPDKVMEMAVKKGSFGLFSIGQRLELLGGSLEIDSAPGHGTSIAITAPLKREN